MAKDNAINRKYYLPVIDDEEAPKDEARNLECMKKVKHYFVDEKTPYKVSAGRNILCAPSMEKIDEEPKGFGPGLKPPSITGLEEKKPYKPFEDLFPVREMKKIFPLVHVKKLNPEIKFEKICQSDYTEDEPDSESISDLNSTAGSSNASSTDVEVLILKNSDEQQPAANRMTITVEITKPSGERDTSVNIDNCDIEPKRKVKPKKVRFHQSSFGSTLNVQPLLHGVGNAHSWVRRSNVATINYDAIEVDRSQDHRRPVQASRRPVHLEKKEEDGGKGCLRKLWGRLKCGGCSSKNKYSITERK